jgi:hypothetical protein
MDLPDEFGDCATPKRNTQYLSPLMRRIEKEADIFKTPKTPREKPQKFQMSSTPKSPSNKKVQFDCSIIPFTVNESIKLEETTLPNSSRPKFQNLPLPQMKHSSVHSSSEELYFSCDENNAFDMTTNDNKKGKTYKHKDSNEKKIFCRWL